MMNYPDYSLVSASEANEVRQISQMWKEMGHSNREASYSEPWLFMSLLFLYFSCCCCIFNQTRVQRSGANQLFASWDCASAVETGTFRFVKTAPAILHRA